VYTTLHVAATWSTFHTTHVGDADGTRVVLNGLCEWPKSTFFRSWHRTEANMPVSRLPRFRQEVVKGCSQFFEPTKFARGFSTTTLLQFFRRSDCNKSSCPMKISTFFTTLCTACLFHRIGAHGDGDSVIDGTSEGVVWELSFLVGVGGTHFHRRSRNR